MPFWGETLTIVHFLDNPPNDGVILRSTQGGDGTGDSWVSLECGVCGAQFKWSPDREMRHVPDRRHLNFCPGCRRIITGVEIPTS